MAQIYGLKINDDENFGEYFAKRFREHMNTVAEFRQYKQRLSVLENEIKKEKRAFVLSGKTSIKTFDLIEEFEVVSQALNDVLQSHAAEVLEVLRLTTAECYGKIKFINSNDKGKKVKKQVNETATRLNLKGMQQISELVAAIETDEKNRTKADVVAIADHLKEAEAPSSVGDTAHSEEQQKKEENTKAEEPQKSQQFAHQPNDEQEKSSNQEKESKSNCGRPKNGQRKYDEVDYFNHIDLTTVIKPGKDNCPNCGRKMSIVGLSNKREYIHFELIIKTTVVTRQNQVMTCNHCNCEVAKKKDEHRRRCIPFYETKKYYEANIDDPTPKGCDYSWGSIANIAFLTYGLGLSQNSVAEYLQSKGIPIVDATINSLINNQATNLVRPLTDMIHDDILRNGHAMYHVDETTYPFIKENAPKAENRYVFVMTTPYNYSKHAVYYSLVAGRDMKTIEENLLCFDKQEQPSMSILSDGYKIYNSIAQKLDSIDNRISCIIHTLRKFTDLINFEKNTDIKNDVAITLLTNIQSAFNKAQKITDLEERVKERNKTVIPEIDFFMEYAYSLEKLNPQSGLAKAIEYAKKEVPLLKNALNNPYSVLDNNTIERLMRTIKKQENNSLFIKTAEGWKALMSFKTLIMSAQLNDIDAAKYLYIVFTELPHTDYKDPEVIKKYLPYSDYIKERIKERNWFDKALPHPDENGLCEGDLRTR
ncbi:MAG: transposase [Candidatus Peribacteria bacterium]|jgi:hypothetical protein|nr:transposase [Candidatus Peribacteria bacterium]